MKRYIISASLLLCSCMCTVSAQTSTSNKTESLGSKISRILNRARKSANKAGKQVGYTLDADGHLNKENDLIKVSGLYYMPLYTVNLYQGKEAAEFRETVRKKFMEKYPQTKLQTVVIPQTDWLHEPVDKQCIAMPLHKMVKRDILMLSSPFNDIEKWVENINLCKRNGLSGNAQTCFLIRYIINY